jgi:nitrite reductase/ring-hydroxylating ferredoxin subunit
MWYRCPFCGSEEGMHTNSSPRLHITCPKGHSYTYDLDTGKYYERIYREIQSFEARNAPTKFQTFFKHISSVLNF